jgi:hypothetical protein
MTPNPTLRELALAAENVELRLQLAEAQEQLVEMAVDAGELQVEIKALQAQFAEVTTDQREAWQTEAERLDGRATA